MTSSNRRSPRKARPPPHPNAIAYTIHDACNITGVGRTKMFELIAAGRIKVSREAGRTLVLGDSLRALFAAQAPASAWLRGEGKTGMFWLVSLFRDAVL